MTQDPYRQPPGTGYVVPGEVVPDDEANVTPPTAPLTQFQKVASALSGDRTDPAMPAYVPADDPADGPADEGADPGSPDLSGTWPGANQDATATSQSPQDTSQASQDASQSPQYASQSPQSSQGAHDDADRDATRPEEIIAVRSPDAGSHDYWDDADETGPDKTAPAAASAASASAAAP